MTQGVRWRVEHGDLPQRLDALSRKYFDTPPLDPWSVEAFDYLPQGLPKRVNLSGTIFEPNQPLLWREKRDGERIVQIGLTSGGKPRFKIIDRYGGDKGLISAGIRAFRIPALGEKKAETNGEP